MGLGREDQDLGRKTYAGLLLRDRGGKTASGQDRDKGALEKRQAFPSPFTGPSCQENQTHSIGEEERSR